MVLTDTCYIYSLRVVVRNPASCLILCVLNTQSWIYVCLWLGNWNNLFQANPVSYEHEKPSEKTRRVLGIDVDEGRSMVFRIIEQNTHVLHVRLESLLTDIRSEHVLD